MARSGVVDDHAHIHAEYYYPDSPEYSVEYLIETMDRDGVEISTVSDACFSFANVGVHYPEGNDHAAKAVERYPERLRGIAVLHPHALGVDAMLREADRTIRDLGFVGYKFHPTCHSHPAGDLRYVGPAIEKAIEHDVPVWIHTGDGPWATPVQVALLAKHYPEAKLIIGHRGHTMLQVATFFAKKMDNLFIDVSFLSASELGRIDFQGVGPDRFIFGSDHPFARPATFAQVIEGSGLSPDQQRLVLGDNAKRLFKL